MLCFICKKSYEYLNDLIYHFKRYHQLTRDSTFRCSECSQSFQSLYSFKRHIKHQHNSYCNTATLNNVCDSMKVDETVNCNIPMNSTGTKNIPCLVLHDGIDDVLSGTALNDARHQESHKFDFEYFQKQLTEFSLKFVLSLHNNDNFSRKDVISVLELANKYLIDPLLDTFKIYARCSFEHKHPSSFNEFCSLVSNFRNPFKAFDSEYLLYKFLETKGYIHTLKEITINHEVRPIQRAGILVNQAVKCKSIVMPLKFQIKAFFEKNYLLQPTLDYMKNLERSDRLKNFVQGELWKEKIQSYPDKILLPYFIYIDDLEINDPLGSHSTKHSICNIYYSFPTLPIEESKLENIFYSAVTRSKDLKSYGNEKCYEVLINEIKDLETNGIDIKKDAHITVNVKFILGLVIGDNLGLNSFLDFSKSFSSNYFCRLCRGSKEETQRLSSENNDLVRTIKNYEFDAANTNFGVVKNSQLNSIPSFHVVNNYYADVMHDLFEGICHYNFCHIIQYFIGMRYFDLDMLNERKQYFEYGPTEIENISYSKIELHHLKNRKLKLSAREMMTFTLYFPIMIGDLVPSDDPVWKFVLNFVEIVDVLLCFEIDAIILPILKKKIEKHNNDYVVLFNDTLKPKFHNLTHYPTIIMKSGPVRNLWCFKYEAKHRQFKMYSRVISSRKNICLTLAKKYELKFAYHLILGANFLNWRLKRDIKYRIVSNYKNIIAESLGNTTISIEFYSQLEYNGIKYKKDNYLCVFNNDVLFYKILEIVVAEGKTLLFFCQKLRNVIFVPHFIAYEVNPNDLGSFSLISSHEILGPPITLIKTAKGKLILRPKEYYKMI